MKGPVTAGSERRRAVAVRRVAFGSARLLVLVTGVAGTMAGLYASRNWYAAHGALVLALAIGAVGLGGFVFVWIARSAEPRSHRPLLLLLSLILVT